MLEQFVSGIEQAVSLTNLLALSFGALVGIVVGILPGIGPMVGMVVLLPFTFAFPPEVALSLLLGVFCGGYYGGAVPAILMRTPGVPSSIFTSFDGFPLTQRGEAQRALSCALLGSFAGGVISVIILTFLAPALAHIAANFGPPEYFSAGLFAISLVVMAYRRELGPGLMLLGLGLWFSTVGIDGPTLAPRYCFGSLSLRNGLHIVPVCLGLYGIGQTFILVEQKILKTESMSLTRRTLDFSKLLEALRYWRTMIRSGVIGTFVGLIPGPGSILASFMSYEAAKRFSRRPQEFGRGNPEGCLASEAGNNAVPAGAMIPLLTLGIPGDALSAVLLGVFIINGVYPGPLLLVKEPVLINTLYISMFLINIVAFLMLAIWLRPFATVVRVPSSLLAVNIMVISMVGIYAVNTRFFDAAVALVMGVLGYVFLRLQWPMVTLVMGVILGPILENRFRESLSLADGNPFVFLSRPISLGLVLASAAVIIVPLLLDRARRRPGHKR
jgi:putative tricarboxylic transport membrane protein